MKKRYFKKSTVFILLFIISLTTISGCTQKEKEVFTEPEPLTSEEKLEDFEYMYSIIKENYPFLKVNERLNGINWLENKDKYIEEIKKADTDDEFLYTLDNILADLNNGHTHVLEKQQFGFFYDTYTSHRINKPWKKVLKDKKVLERYGYNKNELKNKTDSGFYNNPNPVFEKDIVIPNEVAYLKIEQMDRTRVEKDNEKIREFYNEIKNYDKLIIDIRGNSGGSDNYWENNVILPLVKKTLSTDNYIFSRGEHCKPFHKTRRYKIKPIDKLDKTILNKMPEEVESDFQRYYILNRTFSPRKPIDFKGKIYLLVDEVVYSSAESFASFAKDSGFATLVGETTGGDGIGIDPILFSLPNSGVVIRYSSLLVLNGNFTINEEVKTTPHIIIENPEIRSDYKYDQCIQAVIKD